MEAWICRKSDIVDRPLARIILSFVATLVLSVSITVAVRADVVVTVTATNNPRTPSGNPIYVFHSTDTVTVYRTSTHSLRLVNNGAATYVDVTAIYHCGINSGSGNVDYPAGPPNGFGYEPFAGVLLANQDTGPIITNGSLGGNFVHEVGPYTGYATSKAQDNSTSPPTVITTTGDYDYFEVDSIFP